MVRCFEGRFNDAVPSSTPRVRFKDAGGPGITRRSCSSVFRDKLAPRSGRAHSAVRKAISDAGRTRGAADIILDEETIPLPRV